MKKFKIKKDKAPLSDQEIQQNMNFDKFISGYTPPFKGWFSGGAGSSGIIVSAAVVMAVTGSLIYSLTKKDNTVTPFVNPPLKAMSITPDTFVLSTEKDSTVIFLTGTLITIPSNAFVDEKGNDVKGNIQLHYREFHDPIDILLSGIPMNYDSAGTHYQLESAGMFDITATKDGKPLTLKPTKALIVNMISPNNNPTDYNIYNLDTTQKKWNYISENTSKNKTCFPVFEDIADQTKSADHSTSNVSQKPILPKKANPDTDNFSIDFDKNEFPELAVYSGLKFEPVKGENKYNPSFSKKVWEDVLIERCPDNEHYSITFSKANESHSFKVTPVVDENDYATTMKDFASRQKQYEMLLAEKRRNANLKNDSLYQLNSKFQGIALSSNLNERLNSFIDGNFTGASRDLLAYRTFSICRLGIWNSDKPMPFFSESFILLFGEHIAEFVSKDDQPLELKNVYLIKRSFNGIHSIPHSHFDHFPFCQGGVDIMVGITDENQLVYLQGEELKKVETKGKNIRFKMEKVNENIVNAKQLKDLLKI